MGHSYKGQKVPFDGNPYAPFAGPAPILTIIEAGSVRQTAEVPFVLGIIEIEEGSLSSGPFIFQYAESASILTHGADTGFYLRARFTNGTKFSAYSNVVLVI